MLFSEDRMCIQKQCQCFNHFINFCLFFGLFFCFFVAKVIHTQWSLEISSNPALTSVSVLHSLYLSLQRVYSEIYIFFLCDISVAQASQSIVFVVYKCLSMCSFPPFVPGADTQGKQNTCTCNTCWYTQPHRNNVLVCIRPSSMVLS